MGTAQGLTAERMLQIENRCVVAGAVDLAGNLTFTRHDGSSFSGGNVKGPKGDTGDRGVAGEGVPVATISAFTGPFAKIPTGWLACLGQQVSRTTYSALFNIIGTLYGAGNGTSTFHLPNLSERVVAGVNSSDDVGLASVLGAKTKALSASNLPPHQHSIDHDHPSFTSTSSGAHDHDAVFYTSNTSGSNQQVKRDGAGSGSAGYGVTPTDGGHSHTVDVPPFTGLSGQGPGSSTPIDVMQPTILMYHIIKF